MDYIRGIDRNQLTLFPQSLNDVVDENSYVRVIDALVNSLDLDNLGFRKRKHTGRPGYDPADLLKLYVYGYHKKVRSSRLLEEATKVKVEVMWLMNNLSPDFKTIADFRKDNAEAITKACVSITQLWKELGLFGGKLCALDGTKIKANNNPYKVMSSSKLKRILGEAKSLAGEYLKLLEETDDADANLPQVKLEHLERKLQILRQDKKLIEKIMKEGGENKGKANKDGENKGEANKGEANKDGENKETPAKANVLEVEEHSKKEPTPRMKIKKRLEEVAEVSEISQRMVKKMEEEGITSVIPNDPDAILVKPRNGAFIPGYNLQVVVDQANHMIVTSKITRKTNDKRLLTPMGLEAKEYVEPQCLLLADKGYDARRDIITCTKEGYVPVVPKQGNSKNAAKGMFRKSDFIYDHEKNHYICPKGEFLTPLNGKVDKECETYMSKACESCPIRHKCTESAKGRQIKRYINEKLAEAAYQRARDMKSEKIRSALAEHPFGYLKQFVGMRDFITSGLEMVECESRLAVCGYNLRRAFKVLGAKRLLELIKELVKGKGLVAIFRDQCLQTRTLIAIHLLIGTLIKRSNIWPAHLNIQKIA